MIKADVLRTSRTVQRYRKELTKIPPGDDSFFYTVPGKEFVHWRLIKNKFPYDRIAKKHFLLVSRRRFRDDADMNSYERYELLQIKKELANTKEFDFIGESVPHSRTVPNHYHLHLLKFKTVTKYNRKT